METVAAVGIDYEIVPAVGFVLGKGFDIDLDTGNLERDSSHLDSLSSD